MIGARRWIRPAAGLAVAALFVWLISQRVEWPAVRRILESAAVFPLVLGLVALAADMIVRVIRWWCMLRVFEPELPLASCFRPFLSSLALNNTVPLRAGDLVRAFGFRSSLCSPPARVLGTLVIERVLDMLVLLGLFFGGLLGVAVGAVPRTYVAAGAAVGVTCIVAVLILVLMPDQVGRLMRRVLAHRALAARSWGAKAATAGEHFFESLTVLRSPGRAMQLLGLSVLAWTLEGAMFAAVATSLHVGGAPLAPWFALSTGTLATLLPSSPGYVGTFDYFAMLGLTAYGASRAAAAAFALLVHLLLWLPITLVGSLFLLAPAPRRAAETA